MKNTPLLLMAAAGLALLANSSAEATTLFYDDFTSDGSQWGNERGNWTAVGGVYNASAPNNSPPTYTSANTIALQDFTLDVDVNQVRDGGLWLRSSVNSSSQVSGVLLVTGGLGGSYNGLYWHIVQNDLYSPAMGYANSAGLQGSDAHFTVTVQGGLYSAYVNGNSTALTSLSSTLFSSGKVGLYDFSAQTFDNVQITVAGGDPVPEPATLFLMGTGLAGLAAACRKKGGRSPA